MTKPHDELNQKLFNDNELDSKVKDKLLEIVDKFKNNLANDNVKLDIKDVVIVGSSASYNYTKDSDIDLHIVADLSVYPNQEELAGKLYNAYKALFNNKYDPTIYGIPVEVYVEPEGMKANSKGRYSLYNGWVNKPEKEDIPETPDISSEVDEWESKANKCSTIEEIDDFLDSLYQARQSSLISDGEFGVGNLVFKELRNNGTLQGLKDKKVELENKEMSLDEDRIEKSYSNGSEIVQRRAFKINWTDLETEEDDTETYWASDADKAESAFINDMKENMHMTIDKDYEITSVEEVDQQADLNESYESKFIQSELDQNFDNLTLEDYSLDDDFLIMFISDGDGHVMKVVVNNPDWSDEESLSYDIFMAIQDELDFLEDEYIDDAPELELDEDAEFIDKSIYDQLTPEQQKYIDDNDLSLQVVDGIIYMSDAYDESEYETLKELQVALDYDIQESEKLGFNEEVIEESTDKCAKALADYLGLSMEAVVNIDKDTYSSPEGEFIIINADNIK